MRRLTLALLALFLVVAGCRQEPEPPLSEPADVVERMVERMRQDYARAQNFTVVSDSAVVYFERTTPLDSLPDFRVRAAANTPAQQPVPDPYHLVGPAALAQLRTAGRIVGQDTLGGRTVYVVEATDPRSFLMLNPAAPDSGYAVRLYVDAGTFRVAGVRMQQPPPAGAPNPAAGPLVQTIRYTDYRNAGGVTLPHRTDTRIEGLRAITPEEERMVMGANLALQRAQLQEERQLHPAVRARRLADIEKTTRFYQEGVLTGSFDIREVRVNAGSPWGDAPPPAPGVPPVPPTTPAP